MKLMTHTLKIMVAALGLAQMTGCQIAQSPSHSDMYLSSHLAGRFTGVRIPKMESVKELGEEGIFMQKHDYSCGAASLATLLHFYFGESIDELSLLNHIKTFFSASEYRRVEQDGLSFLELTKIADSLGYQSASVRLPMESLDQVDRPVIVYVERDDYRHFAIFKGVVEDRVFLADPSRGNIRMSIPQFVGEWDGRTFVMEKPGFVGATDHALAVKKYDPLRNELISLRTRLKRQPAIDLPPPVLGRRAQ